MNNKFYRKDQILKYVTQKKSCSISELVDYFNTSISTIHRDLDILEREDNIQKVYGSVFIKEKNKVLYQSRINENIELKKRIASKALEFIRNGDCIFLDNSTTCYYLAEALCRSSFKNLLVISNNGFISNLFLNNDDIDLVITGGKLNKILNCYIGPQTIKTLDYFNGNKFFLSASCISIKGSISDIYHIDVIDVKNKMLQKSETSYLLVDSTKFGKISTTKWYELKDMDYIITDNNIPENELKKFNDFGIKITIA